MSVARHHAEWRSLVEVSGPFLSMAVLVDALPQGLDTVHAEARDTLRDAYDEWLASADDDPSARPLHGAWIRYVLDDLLELGDVLRDGQDLPSVLKVDLPEHGDTLRPTAAVLDGATPRLLIRSWPRGTGLERAAPGARWKASPAARMQALLRGTGVRLGLVTNGEHWLLVHAPGAGATTSYVSFYASLWLDEPLTLRAWLTLLARGRLLGDPAATLEALFERSAGDQHEVTDQLGYQTRAAVEILVQAIDRIDQDRDRALLDGLDEAHLYEAACTFMMRLLFLLSAEARDLLMHGNQTWRAHYAVTPLYDQLREAADRQGEAVLERRHAAWNRLLATFRAVHGGIRHEDLRLVAYGGSLFDPDRFPFLEGRPAGTRWRTTPAAPLPIDDRTVMHILGALVQLRLRVPGAGVEARRLSFRELDVEDIGHVYEGLLDHTCRRADGLVLGLAGTKDKLPEVRLDALQAARGRSDDALVELLRAETGRSESALRSSLGRPPGDPESDGRLHRVCESTATYDTIAPYAALLRTDFLGDPVVYRPGTVYVTAGEERRATGTHYTPRGLAERVVRATLEPLVYEGPAAGLPRERWRRRAPAALLALNVCDPAMGSGAFLVAACRYLASELVEAWAEAEAAHPGQVVVSPEGALSVGVPEELPLPRDDDERLLLARRYVADRCLYGVDKNPMAVEMAKLSLWLATFARDRPFTFLDHALGHGDSLLGIHDVAQLEVFDLRGSVTGTQVHLDAGTLATAVAAATTKRERLEGFTVVDARDSEAKAQLLHEARAALAELRIAADLLTGEGLRGLHGGPAVAARVAEALATAAVDERAAAFDRLATDAGAGLEGRPTFHWPLEYPEVFAHGGFDALVGNPPFMGGQKITGHLGTAYREWLVSTLAGGTRGSADLVAYFFLQAFRLVRQDGALGLLATNTIAQGDSREAGLDQIVERGGTIYEADPSTPWPGEASLEVARVHVRRGPWGGPRQLSDRPVERITPLLDDGATLGKPHRLKANEGLSFQGSNILGLGFTMPPEDAQALIEADPHNAEALQPYLNGKDLNSHPEQKASRWVINFRDYPLDRSAEGSWEDAAKKQRKAWLRSGRVPADYPDPVAADWPDLLDIVRREVKPQRETIKLTNSTARQRREIWWRFTRPAVDLYDTIAPLERVLGCAQTSAMWAPAWLEQGTVYSHTVVLFALARQGKYAVMQSSMHRAWKLSYGATLRTDARYTPSDCFETFPFPEDLAPLDAPGEAYHAHRADLMRQRQIGLTTTYNLFHDPKATDVDIVRLRALHVALDEAAREAYGWTDLALEHGFHETDRGMRYTISDAARREVLRRLLELNHARHAEEAARSRRRAKARPPAPAPGTAGPRPAARRSPVADPTEGLALFDHAAGRTGLPLFDAASPAPPGPAPPADAAEAAILAALRTADRPLARADLLREFGLDDGLLRATLKRLLDDGRVTRTGQKRGTRYQLAPDSGPDPQSQT